jgi:hypothetical protein
MDIDSGNESDGKNALREVEEREEPKAARRGPGNASMQHFYDPAAIVDRSGQKCWEFRCRFCTWYVKFFDSGQRAKLVSRTAHAASGGLSMVKVSPLMWNQSFQSCKTLPGMSLNAKALKPTQT